MKRMQWHQIKSMNFDIPNSEGRLLVEQTEETRDTVVGVRTYKNFKFSIDGQYICTVRGAGYWPEVVDKNVELLVQLNIMQCDNTHVYTNAQTLADGLWYFFNPIKITKSNGQIYANVIKAFLTRTENSVDWWQSGASRQIIDAVINHVKDKALREHPELVADTQPFWVQVNKYLKNLGSHNVRLCFLTGKTITAYEWNNEDIGGTRHAIHRDLDLNDYNYTYHDGHWLHPDEAICRGWVYNTVTDSLSNCPTCSGLTPASMIASLGECKACAEESYKIHNYSTRVPGLLSFKAKKVKPDTLYLGVELEFETTDRDGARLKVGKALKGHAIMKSDGSIRHGFEVVTCPATLDIQLDVFKSFYENKPDEITNAPNVGMHVHVSRKPLSMLTVGKLTEFMNRHENKEFITHIAGRTLNGYCNQGDRTISYPLTNGRSSQRYNTLNLCNTDTIEFRIFSTPLTYEDFASKVQFCQAIVDYAKPCNLAASLKEQTYYKTFINWVMTQRKSYPELVSKLKGFA